MTWELESSFCFSPMTRLFKREVAITVTPPATSLGFFQLQTTSTTISNLRVLFSVDKHLGKEPNTCEVTVFNLAENSRALVQRKPLHVRVEAGYDGNVERLFVGDVTFAQSAKNVVDWETRMELGDGVRAFRRARVNRSFRRGIKRKRAVIAVIESMGLTAPQTVRDSNDLDSELAAGLSLSGLSQRELTLLLEPHGLRWSIQDGRMQVLKDAQVRQDVPLVVSQDKGMIGVPEFGSPEKKGRPPILSVKTLLYPSLIPGGRIELKTATINGKFKIIRVTHTGDTHGKEWYSNIEAKSI